MTPPLKEGLKWGILKEGLKGGIKMGILREGS